MTTILFLLISQQSFAGCEGCCSKNGGVVCFSGITICKDHKPLSVQCLEKCNKCQNYSNNKNKNKKSKKKKFDYSQLKYTRKYLNKLYQRGGNLFFCNNSIKRKTKYSFMHIISQEKLKKAFNKVSNKKYDLNKILADPIILYLYLRV